MSRVTGKYLKGIAELIIRFPYFSRWIVLFLDAFLSATASAAVILIMLILARNNYFNYIVVYAYGASFLASIASFLLIKTNRGVMRHTTMYEVLLILIAIFLRTIILAIVFFYFSPFKISPLQLFILCGLDLSIASTTIIGVRLSIIALYNYAKMSVRNKGLNVLVYGMQQKSISVVDFVKESGSYYKLAGFLVFEEQSKHLRLVGLPIYSCSCKESFLKLVHRLGIDAVIFPDEASAREENERLIQYCINNGVKVLLQPQFSEVSEDGTLSRQIREIKIEDLLGREENRVDEEGIRSFIKGKVVMVTGAAGSIGSELCRQISKMDFAQLLLVDNAETPLHNIKLEIIDRSKRIRNMTDQDIEGRYKFVIGDVRDKKRMDLVFKTYKPNIVFHAAAYKHVPLMESNPCEAIMANVFGTKNVADCAVEYGVEKMIMVSTDKAVNPTNVMGCSKRIAEIYVQSLSKAIIAGKVNGVTKFITTRFGNVLGSNGSVIPLFREQIIKGGPVTVTHKDVIRYFMTIPEACNLVLEAATMGNGFEIFVFDMGKPVKIADLAKKMITLAGYVPDKDIKIVYSGLRPGEKLYEELLNSKENTIPTNNQKIFVAKVRDYELENVKREFEALYDVAKEMLKVDTVRKMKEIVPEFKSQNSVYCTLDK
ncbi:MAG: nucleoside-diphosphate sugar epimerase/dehydratase [Candidatus Egerieousia sp.]|nr:nucleoside-diphosphate sugar epimerase/dehydratase [Candidatus Egerieousia sp.]